MRDVQQCPMLTHKPMTEDSSRCLQGPAGCCSLLSKDVKLCTEVSDGMRDKEANRPARQHRVLRGSSRIVAWTSCHWTCGCWIRPSKPPSESAFLRRRALWRCINITWTSARDDCASAEVQQMRVAALRLTASRAGLPAGGRGMSACHHQTRIGRGSGRTADRSADVPPPG